MSANDEHCFEVFFKSGPGNVTVLRGARLETAHDTAKRTANSRRITVYVRNQLTGATEPVQPADKT